MVRYCVVLAAACLILSSTCAMPRRTTDLYFYRHGQHVFVAKSAAGYLFARRSGKHVRHHVERRSEH